jgi:hypothetical protein
LTNLVNLAKFMSAGIRMTTAWPPHPAGQLSCASGMAIVCVEMQLKSKKREIFAIEVASMTPLARAYVTAGYVDTPWAKYNASRLAHTPEVAARISELQEQFAERSGIHAEYLQRQLLPIVEANAADLFEPRVDAAGRSTGYRFKPIEALPRSLSAAISKIRCDPGTGEVTEILLCSKVDAGGTLLRSVGGLKDVHDVQITAPPRTTADRVRALAAFIAETRAETAAIDAGYVTVSNGAVAPAAPTYAPEPEPPRPPPLDPLDAAKRALRAARDAALADPRAAEWLNAKLPGFASAVGKKVEADARAMAEPALPLRGIESTVGE